MPFIGALMGFSLLSGAVLPLGNNALPSVSNNAATSTQALEQTVSPVTLTAYNAVPSQTDSNPFETASGAYSNPEIIAARSVDLKDELPFGTIIELDATNASNGACGFDVVDSLIGYRVIEDSMNSRFTNRIDVLLDTKKDYKNAIGKAINAATVLGVCEGVTYRVVGHVDLKHLPTTQTELAALVTGSSDLALK